LARLVVKRGLPVRQTEALVRKARDGAPAQPARPARDAAFDDLEDELYGLLEAPVRIRAGKRGGKVEVSFKDRAEFESLLQVLRRLER
jgi:ParB family chromosome partitioning protein